MKRNRKSRRHWNTKRPQVLVLVHGKPVNVYDWEDAMTDWANGRARILHHYDHFRIRSGYNWSGDKSVDMLCPSVIMMMKPRNSDRQLQFVKTLPMTKKNIYDRERGLCAFCERKMTLAEMTKDHVYPLDLGGLDDWMNVRGACKPCNNEKDNKTLTELGWELKRRLGIPTLTEKAPKSIVYHLGGRIPHESWRPYIYWEVKTKEKVRDRLPPVIRKPDKPLKKYGRNQHA